MCDIANFIRMCGKRDPPILVREPRGAHDEFVT